MQPQLYDLFGEVVVTQDDIYAWLVNVARIAPDSPRAAYYVKWWDVVGKVRASKACGCFDAITAPRLVEPYSAAWWSRMCWS